MARTIREIIAKDFDIRMEIAVMDYILCNGYDAVSVITDEQIAACNGSGFMTKEFEQAFVRCARTICIEHSSIDVVKYIANMSMEGALKTEIEIYKEDCSNYLWDRLMDKLEYQIDRVSDLEYEEEPETLTVEITVTDAR